MTIANYKIIRDPVHGYIHLNDLETKIINTKIFLRLQHIKQSPTAYLTYPSHYVNRFVHSLGTMELAGKKAFYALEKSQSDIVNKFLSKCADDFNITDLNQAKEFFMQVVRLAGLLHDIGHPPLSHQGENALLKNALLELYRDDNDFNEFVRQKGGRLPKLHEFHTYCLIRDNEELQPLLVNYKDCLLKIFGPAPEGIFATIRDIISSDIDADRADFLLRDGLTSGIGFGQYDIMRLVESMILFYDEENTRFQIVPTTAALSTIEAFLIERYKMYKWLYFHPHVVLTDTALSYLIRKLLEWSTINSHPLKNLLIIREFHYKNYICDEIAFDDEAIMLKLKQTLQICKDVEQWREWEDDRDLAYTLLRIILFREKFGKAIFKNISEYKSFDLELKQKMKEGKVPFTDLLPRDPLLNNYAKLIAGTLPLVDELRFDKILSSDEQFVLETERAGFEPYAFKLSEIKYPVTDTGIVIKEEYKSKFFLLDKKTGKKLFISELSQTVKQLIEAWRNDMQLFLYVIRIKKPEISKWTTVIEESKKKMKEHIIYLWKKDLLR